MTAVKKRSESEQSYFDAMLAVEHAKRSGRASAKNSGDMVEEYIAALKNAWLMATSSQRGGS